MAKFKSAIIIIISLLVIISVVVLTTPDPRITLTSYRFIEALVTDKTPEEYCCGDVLYKVKNTSSAPAEIIKTKTIVIDDTFRYARVYIEVEMKTASSVDVGFYEAELIKENNWKIYSLRETLPKVVSYSLPGHPQIGGVYKKCISNMTKGDNSLLIGPAKTAYKIPTDIGGEISNMKTEILYNNDLVVAKHVYKYDGREVKTLVHYYKTTEGYKIASIQAL